jgi:hypothetical protein
MRNPKKWLAAAFIISVLIGAAALVDSVTASRIAAQEKGPGDHWRFHDGQWSMWNAADRRWYYTDGNHWFFHDGSAWRLYRFDAKFGRGATFVHGDYRAPREEVKIVAPRHEVFLIR